MKKKSKKIIKNNNPNAVKKPTKKVIDKISDAVLATSLVVLAGMLGLSAMPSQPLPEKTAVYKSLDQNHVGAQYLSILDNYSSDIFWKDDTITRLQMPKNMEYFKVNVCFNTTEAQKQVFQEAFDEFNEIFSVINPKYKFKLNFKPTLLDMISPYAINFKNVGEFEHNAVLGETKNIHLNSYNNDDRGVFFNKINLLNSIWENDKVASEVIKHEFMHALGVGDSYLHKTSNDTIMSGVYTARPDDRLKKADIAYLAALYLDEDCTLTEQELIDYINNYENDHRASEVSAVLSNLDYKTFISKISEWPVNTKDKYRIIKALDDNNYVPNFNFGTDETMFYEVDGSYSTGALVQIKDGTLKTAYSTSSHKEKHSVWVKNGFIFNNDVVYMNFGEYIVSFKYDYNALEEKITIKPDGMKLFKLANIQTSAKTTNNDDSLTF